MKTAATIVSAFACALATAHAATTQGDITAAIRGAGGTIAVTAPGTSEKDKQDMVNGKYNDRYLSVKDDFNPITIDFDFGTTFLPGEDIVVTGLTFACGGGSTTELWGNHDKRMPQSWTLSGSNDGTTWTTISTVSGFAGYATGTVGDQKVYSGSVSFANWKSYRQYRLYVTENTGNATYFLQLTEVVFSGLYGGSIVQPDPVLIDVSKSVRDAGKQTCESNAGTASDSLAVGCAYNGIWGKSDRYLSNETTTKGLLDGGQTIDIDYSIADDYNRGADVIVTAYTIDVSQSFADAKARLPKSWQLQGSNDGNTWTTIDTVKGFCAWETKNIADEKTGVEAPHYNYTFKFVNTASFRRYRLAVSELYNRTGGANKIQVSEIQLWGYVDADLAGRVGQAMTGMNLNMTVHEDTGTYAPVITASAYETGSGTDSGTAANLFDGLFNTLLLARLGVDGDELKNAPLTIGYAMQDGYLEGKEIVLKQYAIVSRSNGGIGQYEQRMPKTWRLEGLVGDQWIRIDKQKDFDGWEADAETGRYGKTFALPDNRVSCRQYRLRIFDSHGTASSGEHKSMHQILLFEIEMSGEWGTGIAKPYRPKGLLVSVR